MDKICLIKAGKFFLGVDSACIRSTLHVSDLTRPEEDKESPVHLESFLAQQNFSAVGEKIVFLESNSQKEIPGLLVDSVLDPIIVPESLETLPSLYPSLAERCCPKIFIYNDHPALLLDVAGLVEVFLEYNNDKYSVLWEDIPSLVKKNKEHSYPQEQADDIPESISSFERSQNNHSLDIVEESIESGSPESEEIIKNFSSDDGTLGKDPEEEVDNEDIVEAQPEIPVSGTEKNKSRTIENNDDQVPHNEQITQSDTEEGVEKEYSVDPMDRIVFWIIARYLEAGDDSQDTIIVQKLPKQLLDGVSLNKNELLYLIKKTILKCRKADDNSLRQLIENQGN